MPVGRPGADPLGAVQLLEASLVEHRHPVPQGEGLEGIVGDMDMVAPVSSCSLLSPA